MGLINYTNIEDDTPADANVFNERFGAIIEVLNGGLDAANFKPGGIPVEAISSAIYQKMWPIGSLYFNGSVDTNPATLLGFGTWEAYATGRVPVGVDLAQTEFNAVGKTGGHKELQSHNHTGTTSNSGDHTHFNGNNVTVVGSSTLGLSNGPFERISYGNQNTSPAGNHNHSFTTNNAGGGNAGNLQPFVAVYIWRRTG